MSFPGWELFFPVTPPRPAIVSELRNDGIQFVVVDNRLATEPPERGTYFSSFEPGVVVPLPEASVAKFDHHQLAPGHSSHGALHHLPGHRRLMCSPHTRAGIAIVGAAVVGAWLPEPVRGIVTLAAALGGPTWSFGLLVRRHLAMIDDMAWAVGAILTLVTWSLGMLLLLLLGIHLSRPVVLVLLAAAVLVPAQIATREPLVWMRAGKPE